MAKGEFGDACNRTACTSGNATWFNTSTRQYYCACCARRINEGAGAEGPICFHGPYDGAPPEFFEVLKARYHWERNKAYALRPEALAVFRERIVSVMDPALGTPLCDACPKRLACADAYCPIQMFTCGFRKN